MNKRQRLARRIALGVGIPLVVLALLVCGLFYAVGGFRDNVAQDRLSAFTAPIVAAGGQELCSNGDAGYSPDNRQPWFQVSYFVPDESRVKPDIMTIAADAGYHLVVDTSVAHQTDRGRFYTSNRSGQPEYGPGLGLVVAKDTTYSAGCSSNPTKVSGHGVIYELELTESDT